MSKDTQRLEALCRAIRAWLDEETALHNLTLLVGDAPAACNCREAACPHQRWFPPNMDEFRSAIDSADLQGRFLFRPTVSPEGE